MRVLFLNFNPVHNRVMGFAQSLAQLGHATTVLSVSRDRRFIPRWSVQNGVVHAAMPNFPGRYFGYAPIDIALRLLHMARHHYDVVHAVDHKPNTYWCGYAGRKRPSLFINDWLDLWGGDGGLNKMHAHRLGFLYTLEEKWEVDSKQKADGVVTISIFLQQRALELGCDPQRVICLPNGCDTHSLPSLDIAQARNLLGMPADQKIIGYLGMGINTSEMQMLMRTLQVLPDVKLMVIGPPKSTWIKMATEHTVVERLWQTGYVADSDVHTYLCSANILCTPLADTPASHARLAGKLMSYMVAGRPSVVTPVGETARVIQENNIGLVADPNGYGHAVQTLFDTPGLATELGSNARRCAETTFSNLSLSKNLLAFYQRLKTRASQTDESSANRSQQAVNPS